jgi:tetratricopeptide (TPR) repeat protein
MYLRTPKRYRRQRRQLRLFSRRALLTLLLIPLIGAIGWYLWNNQEKVRSEVIPEFEDFRNSVRTQVAPEPTPTATPDLMAAQSGCLSADQQGHIQEAIEQCVTLAEGRPNDVNLHYKVTYWMVITSNFGSDEAQLDRALDFAERTINANPELPHGWAVRAMVLDWQGEPERALSSALQAKSLDENFAPTYAFLGEIYHDLGQSELGLSHLEEAIRMDTAGLAVAYAYRTRGLIFSSQGDYESALQPYQVALQNAPNEGYIAVELANNYVALSVNQGNPAMLDRAIDVLSATLEKNSSDTMVLFALARVYLNGGSPEKAEEYYHRCLEVDQDNVRCLSWLGGLQWSNGDFATAIVNLERAIQLGSDDPSDFYQLGRSLAALGRCTEAVPYLRQGYQIAIDLGDDRTRQNIISALQSCDELMPGIPAATPTP